MKILFLHGLESKPGGTKACFLEAKGHDVLNPALPKTSFLESVQIAQDVINREQPDIVVGSSRGGAVAMSVNTINAPRVLIAPAWKRYLDQDQLEAWDIRCEPQNTIILHSENDEVIPISESVALQDMHGIKLIRVGDNHRMSGTDALEALEDVVKWLGCR